MNKTIDILNWKAILWDCLEVFPSIPDKSIDCIITDVPYWTTQCKWDTIIPFPEMWEQLKRIIKPNGAISLFWSEPFSSSLRMSNIKQYKYDWYLNKSNVSNYLNAKKQPMRKIETVSIFSDWVCNYYPQWLVEKMSISRKWKQPEAYWAHWREWFQEYTNYPNNLIPCIRPLHTVHPTEKPTALLEYLIKTYTNQQETILDFTAGSFTTAIAAENTNRKWLCIEKDEHYFNVWIERLKNHQPPSKP